MKNTYILKLDSNKLICFYHKKDEGIIYRVFENNEWSKTEVVFRNALENYTVTLSYDRIIYIFCQDDKGNLYICTNTKGVWQSKLVLQNHSNKIHKVFFYPIITENGLTLIYNVPAAKINKGYLVSQNLSTDGKWSEAVKIDNFYPMYHSVFQIQQVAKDHILLFYINQNQDTKIGYRELTSTIQGPYNVFHTTSFQIRDQSFLTTNNEIHVVYIVKTYFSTQLIYRKKSSEGFNKAKVLLESQKIEDCLISIIEDTLHVYFSLNGQFMEMTSNDLGDTFNKPDEVRIKNASNITKANFISESPLESNDYFIRDIYVDKNNPWDIQLLPDIINNFYPVTLKTSDNKIKEPVKTEKEKYIENDYIDIISELKESIIKYRNQLSLAKSQLDEKDKQIINLTHILQTRNQEINQLNLEFVNQRKKLNTQIDELSSRIKSAKKKIQPEKEVKNELLVLKKIPEIENLKSQK